MNPSMSRKGNCYDNAAMESFYGRYKTSSVRDHVFADEAELRANGFDSIEILYNRFRTHSALGYLSPMQAEAKFLPPMGGRQNPIAYPTTKPKTNKSRDSRVSHTQSTSKLIAINEPRYVFASAYCYGIVALAECRPQNRFKMALLDLQ